MESSYRQEIEYMTSAEMSAKEAELRAETLRKSAAAADEKSRYQIQLDA
jgi:hypothetical protein